MVGEKFNSRPRAHRTRRLLMSIRELVIVYVNLMLFNN